MWRLQAFLVIPFLRSATSTVVAQHKDIEFWIAELRKKDNPLAQEEAVAVLEKLGPKARPALDALTEVVASGPPLLRRKAAALIFRIDPDSSVPITAIVDGLKAN